MFMEKNYTTVDYPILTLESPKWIALVDKGIDISPR